MTGVVGSGSGRGRGDYSEKGTDQPFAVRLGTGAACRPGRGHAQTAA